MYPEKSVESGVIEPITHYPFFSKSKAPDDIGGFSYIIRFLSALHQMNDPSDDETR